MLDPGGPQRTRDLVRGLTDQIGTVRLLEGRRERCVRLLLAAPAEDDVEARAGEGRERTERGGDVRRLRVVDVADAAQLADELDPVRDAVEGAQRLGDRGVLDSGRARRCRRGSGVLAVVRAGDARLGGKLVRARELDAARRAGDERKPRGTTAVSSGVWRSKIRSFVSAYSWNVPCRSRWSGSRLRRTATRGFSVSTSSS